MTTPITFSAVWQAWVDAFGKAFWPLVALSAILSIGVGVLAIAMFIGVLVPAGILSGMGYAAQNIPPLSASSIVTMACVGVAFLVIAFVASLWVQTAMILRVEQVMSVSAALGAARSILGRVVRTGFLAGLIVAGPFIVLLGLMIAFGVAPFFSDSIPAWTTPAIATTLMFVFVAGCWALVSGILTSWAGYLAIFSDQAAMDNIRQSWRLVRPYWWQVLFYPFPLGFIVSIVSSISQFVPIIGPFATSIVSTPAGTIFQYLIYKQAQSPIPGPTTPTQPSSAPQS